MSTPFAAQWAALHTGCGVVELSDWSSILLTGADRQPFLHNFCTNDIQPLVPGMGCEAFLTEVRGKIVGHGWVSCREQGLVLTTVPGQASGWIEHLDRYLIREDVELVDTTAERAHLCIAGGEPARDILAWLEQEKEGKVECLEIEQGPIADCEIKINLFLVEMKQEEMPQILQALEEKGALLCGQEAFTSLRIEVGLPLYGIDFGDTNLPQEVGRDEQAISFTKGCYLGQETIARIDAMGHVNQKLVMVQFDGPQMPTTGMELLSQNSPVGRITSVAQSPRRGAPIALAMVRRGSIAPGSQLESPVGKARVRILESRV